MKSFFDHRCDRVYKANSYRPIGKLPIPYDENNPPAHSYMLSLWGDGFNVWNKQLVHAAPCYFHIANIFKC